MNSTADLSSKTITVIGGTGFVGRAVVEALAQRGAKIIVLTRNTEKAKQVKLFGHVGQITAVSGSALDDARLRSVIEPADIVINLVGILAPSGAQSFDAVQAKLPETIGRLAAESDVDRVIHMSAIGADIKSASAYARSKAEGERGLLRQFENSVILRPSVIFGPGDGFFNRFGRMAMMAPALPLIGGGKSKMQPVYVGDVADAVMAVLADSTTSGQIYELGGPTIYSFAELMAYILEVTERSRQLVSVPFSLMAIPAALASLLPNPPLTPDQLRLLKVDNVVSGELPTFSDLGISPASVESVVPEYLASYRPGGRFGIR